MKPVFHNFCESAWKRTANAWVVPVGIVLRRPASYLYTARLFSWPLCEVILCAERTWLLRKYEFTRELPYFSTQSPVAYLHSCTSINSVHAASIAVLTSCFSKQQVFEKRSTCLNKYSGRVTWEIRDVSIEMKYSCWSFWEIGVSVSIPV
jgi:hypothetical protein